MQVFISYAHTPTDTALARYLAARLRDVTVKVWLDESSLKAGDLLQSDIEQAIADSDRRPLPLLPIVVSARDASSSSSSTSAIRMASVAFQSSGFRESD